VTPNPAPNGGVFTNGGTYPYLQALTAAYVQQAQTTFNPAYGGNLYLASYPGGLIWGNQIPNTSPVASTLVNGQLPLSIQNSASRFVRTSMLRDLVGPVAWGSPNDPMSPEAYGTMTAAAMQADGIINSAAIPAKYPRCMPVCDPSQSPEAEGSNVYSGQNEVSVWRVLRDHKRATYFVKVSLGVGEVKRGPCFVPRVVFSSARRWLSRPRLIKFCTSSRIPPPHSTHHSHTQHRPSTTQPTNASLSKNTWPSRRLRWPP
jgi:hypothetical protein